MKNLICPVCKEKLNFESKKCFCENNHSFDFAKEGYVNLLRSNKNGSLIGDNKDMAISRRDFLNKGYFEVLARELLIEVQKISKSSPVLLDICCGEGYYSSFLKSKTDAQIFGFDISKQMIKLAAKRKSGVNYFVANMTDIPLKSGSVDFAFQLFAPFYEKEFHRVLKNDGVLITVTPGKNHLFSLKSVLYDTPYENDEQLPKTQNLKLISTRSVKDNIFLTSNEDIISLFKMTPYYYHTDKESKKRLDNLDALETQVEFNLNFYKKIGG